MTWLSKLVLSSHHEPPSTRQRWLVNIGSTLKSTILHSSRCLAMIALAIISSSGLGCMPAALHCILPFIRPPMAGTRPCTVRSSHLANWPTSVDWHTFGDLFHVDEEHVRSPDVCIAPETFLVSMPLGQPHHAAMLALLGYSTEDFPMHDTMQAPTIFDIVCDHVQA